MNRIIYLRTKEGREKTVPTREELETWLRDLCSDEWHNNAIKIEGEFFGMCDEDSWVSEALEDCNDRLTKFFAAEEEGGEE